MTQSLPRAIPRSTALLSALRHRNYRFYWFGLNLYILGYFIEFMAESWLIWELTKSPLSLGFLGLSNAIPSILLALVGGVLADRLDRLRLILITQVSVGMVLVVLAVLTATGLVQLWHVLVASFLSGASRAFDQPSRQALLPHLISRGDLANAVALSSVAWQLGRIVGPAMAGVLIAVVGTAACFFLAAALHVLMTFLYWLIRLEASSPRAIQQGVLRNFVEGIAFIANTPLFAIIITMTFFNSVFGISYTMLLPVFADQFEAGSSGYGFLNGASGVGALLGTGAVVGLSALRRKGWLVLAGGAAFGVLLILFALSPWLWLSLGIIFLMGFATTFYMTTANTIVQLKVPDEIRGRVLSIYGLAWSLMGLGGMIMGAVADATTANFAVALGGLMVAGLALALIISTPILRRLEA